MRIKVKELAKLAQSKGWSIRELAKRLDVDYSYIYRLIKREQGGGLKVAAGVLKLCQEENLDVNDYIFLSIPLSTDNTVEGE